MEKIKARLPEILEEIKKCKKESNNYLMLYRYLVFECIKETVNEKYDAGIWTTEEVMDLVYEKHERAVRRKHYLEWIVKNIKNFAKNT